MTIHTFFRPYTHVDTPGDIDLETFQLQDEDVIDKVSQQNHVNCTYNLLCILCD